MVHDIFMIYRAEVCVVPDHMVDGYKHLPGNGDDGLFVAATLFQRLVFITEIRAFFVLFIAAGAHCTSSGFK